MIKIFFDTAYDFGGIRLWITDRDHDGRVLRVAKPFTLVWADHDVEARPEPTIVLHQIEGTHIIRDFIAEAEKAGFKMPKVPEQGELAAVKYHLEDMRRLVFEPERVEYKVVKSDFGIGGTD